MKKCPLCAEEIQDTAIKCKHCGSMLRKCPFCAEEIGDNAIKCIHCGSILNGSNRVVTTPQFKQKYSTPVRHQKDSMRISKEFYLASYLCGISINFISIIMGVLTKNPVMFLLALITLLYTLIVMCVMFYKMWAAIQDGYARTSPGKAVGFYFIPFFSLYWVFPLLLGFAKDYNAFIKRYQIKGTELSENLFLTGAILGVISVIGIWFLNLVMASSPNAFAFLYTIIIVPVIIVFAIMTTKICDAINILPDMSFDTELS